MRSTATVLALLAVFAISLAGSEQVATKAVGPDQTLSAGVANLVPRTAAFEFWAKTLDYKTLPHQTDAVDTFFPKDSVYWSGSVTASAFTDTSMVRAIEYEDGWWCFDVTGIPDAATINSVELYYYVNATYYPYYDFCAIDSGFPANNSAGVVKQDVTDNIYLSRLEGSGFAPGWYNYLMGGTAVADLQASLTADWFGIGLNSTDDYISYFLICDGWAETNTAYIVVDYSAPVSADVECSEIIYPTGAELWMTTGHHVRAIVRNNDAVNPQTFDVHANGGSGNDVVTVTALAPGASQTVDFTSWTPAAGPATMTISTQLAGDADPSNDTLVISKNVPMIPGDSVWYHDSVVDNGYYYYEFNPDWVMATQFTPTAWPCYIDYVAAGLLGPFNGTYWPWPDPSLDSMRVHIWLDSDGNGLPNEPEVYYEQLTNDTCTTGDDFIYAVPEDSTILVSANDFWVGIINCQGGGSDGILVSNAGNTARQWNRNGVTPFTEGDWINQNLYGCHWLRSWFTAVVFDNDVGVRSIESPSGLQLAGTYPAEAYVKNYGMNVLGPFDVVFEIGVAFSETLNVVTLAAGDSALLQYSDWTSPGGGSYAVRCTILLTDDNMSNQQLLGSVLIIDYYEDFDSDDGGFTEVHDAAQWEWGDPDFPAGPEAYTTPNCWGTNLTGYYTNSAFWRLTSVEFEALADNPILLFYQWLNCESFWDGGNVKYSTDGGSTWTLMYGAPAYYGPVIGLFSEDGYSGLMDNWAMAQFTVPVLTGATFNIQWTFGSDGSVASYPGWYIDDVAGVGFNVSGNRDIGITSIDAPTGTVQPNNVEIPSVTLYNYGDIESFFDVYFTISDTTTDVEIYNDTVAGISIPVGTNLSVDFTSWTAPTLEGPYATFCEALVPGDTNPADNTAAGNFDVFARPPWPTGWVEKRSMPTTPSGKPVKRGGWLAEGPDDEIDGFEYIYAQKGYKTNDFYKYDIWGDSFTLLTGMPWTAHPTWFKKAPRKGSKGASDRVNTIYVTQGNNSLGWWKYEMDIDSWTILNDVPYGVTRKKVKGGGDLAYLVHSDTGYVYFMKGYKSEFYRYNVETGVWETLGDMPAGIRAKWNKGSWICVEGQDADVIYAAKARYNELWKYYIAGDSFTQLAGMPFIGRSGRKKKMKDGASAAWYDGDIYALKGGNTQQFWMYDVPTDTWVELDTMPANGSTGKKKRVKYGADIVSYGYGFFFALKGNKTVEFWRYGLPVPPAGTAPERSGVMAGPTVARDLGVTLAPNPLSGGFVTLRYALPSAGPATINVVDVVGRTVDQRRVLANRTGAVNLDLRSLSAGVYLVRFETDGYRTTRKLVVQ